MGQRNWIKEHWLDNPGAWEKWKKEQGARENDKRAKKKGKGSEGGKVKGPAGSKDPPNC